MTLAAVLIWALLALACGSTESPLGPALQPDGAVGPASPADGGAVLSPDAGPSFPPDAGTPLSPDGGGAEPPPACEPTAPRTVPTTVFALPDAGEAPFTSVLAEAQSSIRVMVYLMGYGGILDLLKDKARAGVRVRVILDRKRIDTNQKYFDDLTAAGAEVHWSDPSFTYMHAKIILVDDRVAVVATGNFSKTYSIELERNFVAQVRDPADISSLSSLFDSDWEGRAPNLSCTRLLVSPVNSRARLLGLIESATTTLDVESMQFADTEVRARVAARKAAGVRVRAILAEPSWISANADAAAFLRQQGIEVRTIPHCHVKAIIADGVRAYLGSENLSYTSLTRNREVGLVVTETDAVRVMTTTFVHDWEVGSAL
jgi:phosphatidylserine/phosphatidylglycerophosphate/cardiolipin synthase-like enzyme